LAVIKRKSQIPDAVLAEDESTVEFVLKHTAFPSRKSPQVTLVLLALRRLKKPDQNTALSLIAAVGGLVPSFQEWRSGDRVVLEKGELLEGRCTA